MEGRLISGADTNIDEQSAEPPEHTPSVSSSLYSDELRTVLPTECFFISWNVFQKYFLSVCKPLKRPLQPASEGISSRVPLNYLELTSFRADLSVPEKAHQSPYTGGTTERGAGCSQHDDEKSTATPHVPASASDLEANSVIAPVSVSASINNNNITNDVVKEHCLEQNDVLFRTMDASTASEHKSAFFTSPKRQEKTYKASTRIIWTKEMNDLFVTAYNSIIGEVPTPVRILRFMSSSYPGLTQKHVQSKLQKYRLQNNLKASVIHQSTQHSRFQTQRQQQRQRRSETHSITPPSTHLASVPMPVAFPELQSITPQPSDPPTMSLVCVPDTTETPKTDPQYS